MHAFMSGSCRDTKILEMSQRLLALMLVWLAPADRRNHLAMCCSFSSEKLRGYMLVGSIFTSELNDTERQHHPRTASEASF